MFILFFNYTHNKSALKVDTYAREYA